MKKKYIRKLKKNVHGKNGWNIRRQKPVLLFEFCECGSHTHAGDASFELQCYVIFTELLWSVSILVFALKKQQTVWPRITWVQ